MNTRLLKINAEIKKTISQIMLYDLNNPKITGIVSVTKVNTSNDLSLSKVHISIADKENQQQIFNEITKSAAFIRKNLSQKINLRKTPVLEFLLDDTVENAEKIEEMIEKIANLRGDGND